MLNALSEPSPFQMGLQVACGVRAQAKTESHFWADVAAVGTDLPRLSTAEGMPDCRRASHAGSCTHVHRDSAQTPGGFGDRVSQREERDRDGSAARQGPKFLG